MTSAPPSTYPFRSDIRLRFTDEKQTVVPTLGSRDQIVVYFLFFFRLTLSTLLLLGYNHHPYQYYYFCYRFYYSLILNRLVFSCLILDGILLVNMLLDIQGVFAQNTTFFF